ncbi:hypothetical protein CRYUN_Cryun26dG0080300 [Craigia yunnanensis]
MARKISMAALFVVLAATLLQSTFAVTYTVGNSTGWIRPTSNNADLYDNWAENMNFVVGDILVFSFTTGEHDVAEVTKTAYEACNTANTTFTWTNGPQSIPLNSTGERYFICTFPNHCSAGQKLEVEVHNGTSTASTPGSSPNTPTGTPSNSASSLVSTLSLVFMSIVLVLLCY